MSSFVAVFLEPPDAAEAIVDESIEPYISLVGEREALFMSGEEGLASYGFTAQWRAAVRPWKEEERLGIRSALLDLYPALGSFEAVAALPWSFIKARRGFCAGMAHTRHRHIIFDEGICERYGGMVSNSEPEPEMRASLLGLLAHEQLHIFQRLHPQHASAFYLKLWGGKRHVPPQQQQQQRDRGRGASQDAATSELVLVSAAQLTSCNFLNINRVTNPDGVHLTWLIKINSTSSRRVRWLWPRTLIDPEMATTELIARSGRGPPPFLGVAIEMNQVMPSGASKSSVIAEEHRQGGKTLPCFRPFMRTSSLGAQLPVFEPLEPLFTELGLFPAGFAYDHPNEVSAYVFAELVKERLGLLPLPPTDFSDGGVVQQQREREQLMKQLAPEFEAWLSAVGPAGATVMPAGAKQLLPMSGRQKSSL